MVKNKGYRDTVRYHIILLFRSCLFPSGYCSTAFYTLTPTSTLTLTATLLEVSETAARVPTIDARVTQPWPYPGPEHTRGDPTPSSAASCGFYPTLMLSVAVCVRQVLVFHLGMLGATFNPYTPLLSIAFLMLFSAYEYIRSR